MDDSRASTVDVGIPAYGRPQFLVEALESVLGQTFEAFTLTVSDNGPGGGDVQRAVEPYLTDPRVRYVATGGVSPQENWGRVIRTGDAPYVGMLHDDDVWDPEFLARRVAFLEAHPECGFVFGNTYDLDRNGRRTDRTPAWFREGVLTREQFLTQLYQRNPVGPPSLLVRRTAYEAAGAYYSEEFPTHYDHEMLLRLAVHAPMGYLDVRDAGYRLHQGSATFKKSFGAREHVACLDYSDRLMETALSGFRIDARVRARERSFWSLRAALDQLEQGHRRLAREHLHEAVRLRRAALLDPRLLASVGALLSGSLGRAALVRLRAWRDRRGWASRAV